MNKHKGNAVRTPNVGNSKVGELFPAASIDEYASLSRDNEGDDDDENNDEDNVSDWKEENLGSSLLSSSASSIIKWDITTECNVIVLKILYGINILVMLLRVSFAWFIMRSIYFPCSWPWWQLLWLASVVMYSHFPTIPYEILTLTKGFSMFLRYIVIWLFKLLLMLEMRKITGCLGQPRRLCGARLRQLY